MDRGFPSPALEDTLVQRAGTIGGPIAQDGERRNVLVLGCGRGVDVLLFASFGYDAYGLECSAAAVEACNKEEKENHSRYRVRDKKVGKGKVTFVQGDFFDDTWLKEIGVLEMDLMSFMITRYVYSMPLSGSIPLLLLFSLHLYSGSYRGIVLFLTYPGFFWSFWTFLLTTI